MSIVQTYSAGVGSVFPKVSTAATSKVWFPATSGPNELPELHGAKGAPSIRQTKVPVGLVLLKVNIGVRSLSGSGGVVSMTVSGMTTCISTVDTLPKKSASPPYEAVMLCDPEVRAFVVKVATPAFKVSVPRTVAPLLNVTVPVGTPVDAVTIALNVTA